MSILIKFLSIYYHSRWRGSYRLTDFLSRRLTTLQCVPIKTRSGILYVDLRNSSSRGILASPESQSGEDLVMLDFVKKGDIAFDIGAHLGFYTLLLSELVGEKGKVFAFEPNPKLLPSLTRTVEPFSNIKLLSVALSDREGEINLFVPEDASMASLKDWTKGAAGKVQEISCKMQILDKLIEKGELPLPQFIKCDVEGSELSVFKGATNTLNRMDAPILLFELNRKAASAFGTTTTAYFDFLESLEQPKYSFFEVTKDGLIQLKSKEIEYTNVLAVPQSISKLSLIQTTKY